MAHSLEPTEKRMSGMMQASTGDIKVKVKRDSCTQATIRWKRTSGRDSEVDITVERICASSHTSLLDDTPARVSNRRPRRYPIPHKLDRGATYRATVCGVTSGLKGEVTFRAVFTPEELQTLYTMAVDYVEGDGFANSIFFRNKPEAYFMDLFINNNNIMPVYLKDNNGDPASIINGQIDGLFFATRDPRNISHFGDFRVKIPATAMLTADKNIYFADFYCNYSAHYVTVVLTKPGSDTDRFCESNLIKLDITDNAFLKRNHDEVVVTTGVWIEVLYTEDVDLSGPEWELTRVYSTGTSTPGGLPKNPNCQVCNLPNTRRKVLVQSEYEMADTITELLIEMKEMELK